MRPILFNEHKDEKMQIIKRGLFKNLSYYTIGLHEKQTYVFNSLYPDV